MIPDLQGVLVRGPHPLDGFLVNATMPVGDRLVLLSNDAGEQIGTVELNSSPIRVRRGYVLPINDAAGPIMLVQCVECGGSSG